MNVELINPVLVPGLFARGDPGGPKRGRSRPRAWTRRWRARFDEAARYRGALKVLRQLDDRELDDLGLAPTDLPALAWRHARSFGPAARAQA
jgi:uncharacterized protein YjiS (DUF1127 family)